jgi:hypothetical protein
VFFSSINIYPEEDHDLGLIFVRINKCGQGDTYLPPESINTVLRKAQGPAPQNSFSFCSKYLSQLSAIEL